MLPSSGWNQAPTETCSKSITASNCHNLAGMWLNVGGPYHLDSFGCQPNPSPTPLQRLQPLVGPHCVTVATGQIRGGASVPHLVVPAAHCTAVVACGSVCMYVCLHANPSGGRVVRVCIGVYSCMFAHTVHLLSYSLSLTVPSLTLWLHKAV